MIIETERLILRPWCDDDAPDLYIYASDPEVAIGKRFDRVNEYIDNVISNLDAIVSTLPSDRIESWDELNNMFLEMLK